MANPSALLFAACMMLEHVGEPDAARRVRQALEDTLREGKVRTRDLGGNASTQAFADAVSRRLG